MKPKRETRMVFAKADPVGATSASFVGYASVFDVIDSYGDVVRKGAFAKSIEALTADGAQPLGVYYAHNMNGSPYGLVGVVKSLVEDDHGLKVEADLYVESNPEAKFLHQAMQDGVINEMSFAYYVTDGGWGKHDGEEFYEIKGVDLLEVSVCPVGVNRQALIQEVKARLTPARKRDDVVIVEDEGVQELEDAKADEDAEVTAVETLATIRDTLAAAIEAIDALEASDDPDDEDQADEPADEDSKAAAEEAQKAAELTARAASLIAAVNAGEETK